MVMNDLDGVKNEIRAVLISNKNGMVEKDLISMYREFCHKNIPFEKFGYSSVSSFLESLSDVVQIREAKGMTIYSEIPTKETQHISKLVKSQINSKSGPRVPSVKEQKAKKGKTRRLPSHEISTIKDIILRFPKGLDEESFSKHFIEAFGKPLNYKIYGFQDIKECLESIPHFVQVRSKTKGNYYFPSKSLSEEMASSKTNTTKKPSSFISIPQNIVNQLYNLMKSFPEGLDVNLLLEEYRKKYGYSLDFQDFGFTNLSQLVKSLNLEKRESSLFLPHASSTNKQSLNEVNENIRKILEAEKGIILSIDIGDFYHKHCGTNVDLFSLGFQNMDGLLHALSDQKNPYFTMQEIAGPRYLVRLLQNSKINSTNSLCSIKQLGISQFTQFVDVIVEQYDSPSSFYVRLKKHDMELNQLMENLGQFCRKNKLSLKMVAEDLFVGNFVAALHDKVWHRGKIMDTSSLPDFVTIFYLDYGTTSSVATDKIVRLGTDFYDLPQQAIYVRLGRIPSQSLNDEFVLKKCAKYFRGDELRAKFISFDSEGIPTIDLALGSGDESILLNDVFFNGLAKRSNGSEGLSSSVPLRKPHSGTLEKVGKRNSSRSVQVCDAVLAKNRPLRYIVGFETNGCSLRGPLVTSSEISNLFPKWKRKDLLVVMLDYKDIMVESYVISKTEHSKLWSLARNVPGFHKDTVTLFQLSDVPLIMSVFSKNEKDITNEITNLLSSLGLNK